MTSHPGASPLLDRLIGELTPYLSRRAWYVAFSGGLDSTVLLHLLAQWSRRQRLPELCAVHVHHGLQTVARQWPAHCQRVCAGWGITLQVLDVTVTPQASVEQAARTARYAALGQLLGDDELLLTAQHRDDQAETVLLRLLRGAGVRGLAGMPLQRRLQAGWLVRPLLAVSREQLLAYAREQGLEWIEDPSNADGGFARNYLRNEVLAPLRSRWPQATVQLARTAHHMREALELLEEVATTDLQAATGTSPWPWLALPSLEVAALRRLSPARQRNALQAWLAPLTRLPDTPHWAGWDSLRDAREQACPIWRLTDGELHRSAGRLWWLPALWCTETDAGSTWDDVTQPLDLGSNGQVRWHGPVPRGRLRIGYRQGGEVLDCPGRGRRDLKRLLNEAQLPAFVRGRLPLLFDEHRLLAVANLPQWGMATGQLEWRPPTNAQRLR